MLSVAICKGSKQAWNDLRQVFDLTLNRACTLTLGAVNTPLWDAETVQSDFDRRAMLSVDQAAEALVNLAEQPVNQVIEDLTLMPAAGAF